MKYIIDKYYDKYEQTKNIVNKCGFITFTKYFKYVGSWISYDLDDRCDIESRTKKVNQATGTLKLFWIYPQVDIREIIHISLAVLIHLFLWDCEYWDLNKDLIYKLEVFHMRCI